MERVVIMKKIVMCDRCGSLLSRLKNRANRIGIKGRGIMVFCDKCAEEIRSARLKKS